MIRYIDANVLALQKGSLPSAYPFCSARHYARLRGPPWLQRDEVERVVAEAGRSTSYDPTRYWDAFPLREDPDLEWVHAQGRRFPSRLRLAVAEAAALGGPSLAQWLREREQLADGRCSPAAAMAHPSSVELVLDSLRREQPVYSVGEGRCQDDGWNVLRAGLLRFASGLTGRALARRLGRSKDVTLRWLRLHRQQLALGGRHADLAAKAIARLVVPGTGGRPSRPPVPGTI